MEKTANFLNNQRYVIDDKIKKKIIIIDYYNKYKRISKNSGIYIFIFFIYIFILFFYIKSNFTLNNIQKAGELVYISALPILLFISFIKDIPFWFFIFFSFLLNNEKYIILTNPEIRFFNKTNDLKFICDLEIIKK